MIIRGIIRGTVIMVDAANRFCHCIKKNYFEIRKNRKTI